MLRYTSNNLGTITIVQQHKNEKGELEPREFEIQIREGNCLAVFIYVYKEKEPEDPKHPYVHQLVNFLSDEKHIKNIVEEYKTNVFASMFMASEIKKVKLNLFFKESNTLLKYMVRDGLKVECYYEELENKWNELYE